MKRLGELFWAFFRIGALTFGGGYAMIALLDHECVEKRQWLTADELMDITVVAESTPGPIAINCATYTGWRQAGLAGAVSATVGIVLPAFLLFWGLSFCFEELLDLPVLEWAFRGIRAAVAVLVLEAGAIDVLVADTPALKRDAWAARSSFLEAIMADTKLLDECDVVVPVTQIANFLVYVDSLEQEVGLKIRSFGHAGDGNLHIYCCSNDLPEDEFKVRAEKFMEAVYLKATELGGQVSGEHGIGYAKKPYLRESLPEKNLDLMNGIKKVFDPKNILNPHKVAQR